MTLKSFAFYKVNFSYYHGKDNIIIVELQVSCPFCQEQCSQSLGGEYNEMLRFRDVEWHCLACKMAFYPDVYSKTAGEHYQEYMANQKTVAMRGINETTEIQQCFIEETRKNEGIKKGRGSGGNKFGKKRKRFDWRGQFMRMYEC